MKNTVIREFLIIVLMMITVSAVAKIVRNNKNFNSPPDAAGMEDSVKTTEKQSVIWFIEHRAEADALVRECRRNASAGNTENCINAEFALKLAGK